MHSILPRFVRFGAVPVWLFSALLTLGLTMNSMAETPRTEWKGQWISHPTAPLKEPITLHFKKSIEVKDAPAHFVVHVSADNRFVLYLNGQRVGDGPARGDIAHWRYETFDLAPMLKPGTNTLAATVWNFGVFGPVAQITDRTAFLVEGDTAAEAAANTNKTWLVEEEQGQIMRPRKANGLWVYYAVGPGETLKAADYDWKWMDAGSTGGAWVAAAGALREYTSTNPGAGGAASFGTQADVPWALVPDTLPHMAYTLEDAGHLVRVIDGKETKVIGKDEAAQNFPHGVLTVQPHTSVHLLFDRGELTTAYPRLKFSGGKGASVAMVYAEALYDEKLHKGNRNEVGNRKALGMTDEVIADGGVGRVFEPLWWRTWRYLDIAVETGDAGLQLDGLEAYYTAYPFEVKAKFESSDPELDKIWAVGWHTAQLDAHETYMDTPYYEQLQYSGDTRLQEMITYTMTGTDLLPRQAIRALDDSRIPEGITASRYPSQLAQYIPTFSLLWIGMLHDNYMYRPDTQFVKEILPGTRTVLSWYADHQDEDGVLRKLPWWSFVDWIETETKRDFPAYDKHNESCLTTMEYIGALEEAIDLEKAVGAPEYVSMYAPRLDRAKKGVIAQCWDASKGLFADNNDKDMYSEHTNMLAVLYDVAPVKEQRAIMEKVVARRVDGSDGTKPVGAVPLIGASFYFRYYLARALDHAGMADLYTKTLGDWRGFLKMGFSTWPEQPGDTRSDSHAWTAHPTYDLLTLVAGIAPGSPGFKTVRIAPHLGGLTSLNAAMPHDKGLIQVKYEGTNATVTLPDGLDGVFVWKGKETTLHAGENKLSMK